MSVAKQALTQGPDRFTFIVTPKKKPDILRVRGFYCNATDFHASAQRPNTLQIRWEYYQEMTDFQGRLAGQIDVAHAPSEAKVAQSILSTAVDNLASLQVILSTCQQICAGKTSCGNYDLMWQVLTCRLH